MPPPEDVEGSTQFEARLMPAQPPATDVVTQPLKAAVSGVTPAKKMQKKPQLTAGLEHAFSTILAEFQALTELKAVDDELSHQMVDEQPKRVCLPSAGGALRAVAGVQAAAVLPCNAYTPSTSHRSKL